MSLLRLQELAFMNAVLQFPQRTRVHMDHGRNLHIFKYYYHISRIEKIIGILLGHTVIILQCVKIANKQPTRHRYLAKYAQLVCIEMFVTSLLVSRIMQWQWWSNRIFLGLDNVYHQQRHRSKIQQIVDDIVFTPFMTIRTYRWRLCMCCHDYQCLFLFQWKLYRYFNGREYVISENDHPEHPRKVRFDIYMCARCIAYKMYQLFIELLSNAAKQQTQSVRMSNVRKSVARQIVLRKKFGRDVVEQIMRFVAFDHRHIVHLSKYGTIEGNLFCYGQNEGDMLHIMDRVYEFRK